MTAKQQCFPCDFCNRPATWRYPARPVRARVGPISDLHGRPVHLTVRFLGRDEWDACAVCARLIDTGRRDELAQRAHRAARVRLRVRLREIPRRDRRRVDRELLNAMRGLHDDFWAARLGPPSPITVVSAGVVA